MKHIEGFVQDSMPSLLRKEEDYWQPSDFTPDMGAPDAFEQVKAFQEEAEALSDDVMVVLIGDTITEEALPTYSSWISQVDGFDRAGEPRNAWGDWLRKWTAEENRHGDILHRYLYLSGRINMREVECTVHNLLADGGDVQTGVDPYKSFAYTSFQEAATNFSHKNVAALARKAGAKHLEQICQYVAGDESRHTRAYKLFFEKCLEVDTSEALIAFYDIMRNKVTMPAMYMRERGKSIGETFKKFADVAERTGIYTQTHYIEILESLNRYWNIDKLSGLSSEAAKAQDYLCGLAERYRKIIDRMASRKLDSAVETPHHHFLWLKPFQPPATLRS